MADNRVIEAKFFNLYLSRPYICYNFTKEEVERWRHISFQS